MIGDLTGQPEAPFDDAEHVPRWDAVRPRQWLRPRPLAHAALIGRPVEREVLIGVGAVDLHLIQVQKADARHGEPHITSRRVEIDLKRLAIAMAVEDGAIVGEDLSPGLPILGQEQAQTGNAVGGAVTTVVDGDPTETAGILEVYLPPGRLLQAGVESPASIDDAIDSASGVLHRRRHRPPGAIPAHGVLGQPVLSHLIAGGAQDTSR